jgi:hypothetical protein
MNYQDLIKDQYPDAYCLERGDGFFYIFLNSDEPAYGSSTNQDRAWKSVYEYVQDIVNWGF